VDEAGTARLFKDYGGGEDKNGGVSFSMGTTVDFTTVT